jgi:GAF domain-containing protein
MRRGAKPAKAKVQAKPSGAGKSPTNEGFKVLDLEKRLAEAHEQQAATAEILRVISSSPTNAQPVFDAIAVHALRLCHAHDVIILRMDGDVLRRVAHQGPIPPPSEASFAPTRDTVGGRTVLDGRPIHVVDLQKETGEFPVGSRFAQQLGSRTVLGVPLLNKAVAIGVIYLRRTEVQPFTDSQIALLQTFADQAVIAIDNLRLFNETKEALEQQTATSEILGVISSSPTEVRPVLDAIARRSVELCDAYFANIFLVEDEMVHWRASHNVPPEANVVMESTYPLPTDADEVIPRIIRERRMLVLEDGQRAGGTAHAIERARAIGHRSWVGMPLVREGSAIGVLAVSRREVKPFSDKQIALLQTFADQAVIAIENVRLFTELQEKNQALTQAHAQVSEALEQQTATSEILRVISDSPTDVQPVFDVIAASARRMCGAVASSVLRLEEGVLHLAAASGVTPAWEKAARGLYPAPVSGRRAPSARAAQERRVVELVDVEHNPESTPGAIALARTVGFRTSVALPMLRGAEVLGVIQVARAEPAPFPRPHVELLQTFADQAVIAIENVRLFKELQASNRELTTALDTQTATSDILRVISRSQTDVQPVFDAILASAVRLLRGYSGALTRVVGTQIVLGALTSTDDAGNAALRSLFPQSLQSSGPYTQALRDRAPVNVADAETDRRLPELARAVARARGHASWAVVPMLRDDEAIGTISVTRREPGGLADDEIELLKTFADQAVIAIENVRLFTEVQEKNRALTQAHSELTESLEQQTGTAEILRVIASSPTDAQPVFDTIAANASRLCGGIAAIVTRFDGEMMHLVAHHNPRPGIESVTARLYPRPPGRDTTAGRAILERTIVHISDAARDPDLAPNLAVDVHAGSFLAAPMVRDGRPIGAISVSRVETGAFPAGQGELLETFADQAVIAIENVRLFTELEEKNSRLTVALDQQTATSEVLRAISSSVIDLQPVFDTIVRNAVKLCAATFGGLQRIVDGRMTLDAQCGVTTDELAALQRDVFPLPISRGSATGRAVVDRAVVHIRDIREDPEFGVHLLQTMQGFRTILAVPMLREGVPIGALALWRREVLPFSDTEISLVQTFADQAVIAVENVRLFKELDARTQDLTRSVGELRALGEVGQAISSTLDLQTVLSTIVARATELSGTDAGVIYEYDAQREVFLPRATEHLEAEIVETMLATPVRKGEGATGRLAEVQEAIQVPDILAAPAESRVRGVLVRAGYRALLAAPLVREEQLIGALTVIRKATGEFPAEVIDLLRAFATQSALAIQNARLFREIADKSRQLEVVSQHKSEFLANMSHELRTPLNAIIGFSEVLSERMFGELNEKQDEYLKDIHASGQHLLSLINDILDLSKIEAGRMELDLTDISLPAALDNAVTLVRERAGRRGIALHMTVDERLEHVRADERKVRQVVLNLLSNAIKFTPEGGRIEVRAAPVDGAVEVSVSDTGVGIAPEDQEAVFEEFRQVGTADKKVEGTGLGLALSRKFIELHGGKIWVKSQVGAGSTFTFTIPMRRGE